MTHQEIVKLLRASGVPVRLLGVGEWEPDCDELVLDFRGGADAASRWDKYAKRPLAPAALPDRLDPRTGLKASP